MSEMNSLTLNGKTYDCFVDGVARASVVVCSASGESITVSDSSDQPLVGLNIYGKSTQAGTPTPDTPVDIESVGDDGSMVVTVGGNTMALTLANGLRGIPVTDKSIATYVDANGQMWCADEIDFERGVYVQRIYAKVLTGKEGWAVQQVSTGVRMFILNDNKVGQIIARNGLSNIGYVPYSRIDDGAYGFTYAYNYRIRLENMNPDNNTLDELKVYLNENPITVIVPIQTPVETPLTSEQIAAFKALHTNKPSTTITNGENAYMSMAYIADAKAYIDNKASGIIQATVE